MIAIIDYNMGNIASVRKALEFLGGRVQVTSDPRVVAKAGAVIFPGVGAFGPAMRELKSRRLVAPIVGSIREGKPFLGLCLGLQLLFESSEESPGVAGLGVLRGKVRRMPAKNRLKIPHMGWNSLLKKGDKNPLLSGVPDGAHVYFVHSFYAQPEQRSAIAATTEYGVRFPSVIWNGEKLWATQFHPEKSHRAGLAVLKTFPTQRTLASC